MTKATLKAVEIIARPPLTSVRDRLRILADELPDHVRSVIVLTAPDCAVYNFGEVLNHAEAIGYLVYASRQFELNMERGSDE